MNDQTPPPDRHELTGALVVESGLSLPEIWQTLHANAREWRNVPRNSHFYTLREMLDDSDRDTLAMLRETDAVQWEQICNGAGWTAIGAVALSWCRDGADFRRAADRWVLSQDPICKDERCRRTAGMLDPRCRLSATTLTELVAELEGNVTYVALALAAWGDRFKMDMAPDVIATAPQQIRQFLEVDSG